MRNSVWQKEGNLKVGDSFDCAWITWKILDITEDGYLCLGELSKKAEQFDKESNNWKLSNLRKYLNNVIYSHIANEVGEENIIPFERNLLAMDGSTDYGTCVDKVSLLSFDEYRRYRPLIPNCRNHWWTLTPLAPKCKSICIISSFGEPYFNYENEIGERYFYPLCIFASALFKPEGSSENSQELEEKGNLEQRVAALEKQVRELQGKATSKSRKKATVGDIIEIAGLKWKILEINEHGYVCRAEFLKDFIPFDSDCNDWKMSTLRNYLNTEFYNILAGIVGEKNIIPFERSIHSTDGQLEYGIRRDKVSILSVDEYRKYRNLIPNDGQAYWLLTPDNPRCKGDIRGVRVISGTGEVGNAVCNYKYGRVAPVCIFSPALIHSECENFQSANSRAFL